LRALPDVSARDARGAHRAAARLSAHAVRMRSTAHARRRLRKGDTAVVSEAAVVAADRSELPGRMRFRRRRLQGQRARQHEGDEADRHFGVPKRKANS